MKIELSLGQTTLAKKKNSKHSTQTHLVLLLISYITINKLLLLSHSFLFCKLTLLIDNFYNRISVIGK